MNLERILVIIDLIVGTQGWLAHSVNGLQTSYVTTSSTLPTNCGTEGVMP